MSNVVLGTLHSESFGTATAKGLLFLAMMLGLLQTLIFAIGNPQGQSTPIILFGDSLAQTEKTPLACSPSLKGPKTRTFNGAIEALATVIFARHCVLTRSWRFAFPLFGSPLLDLPARGAGPQVLLSTDTCEPDLVWWTSGAHRAASPSRSHWEDSYIFDSFASIA